MMDECNREVFFSPKSGAPVLALLMACMFSQYLAAQDAEGAQAWPRIPAETVVRMELAARTLEATLPPEDPCMAEIAERFSVLAVIHGDHEGRERHLRRLVAARRVDLLCYGLLATTRGRTVVGDTGMDPVQIGIVEALRSLGDKRSLPYLVFLLSKTAPVSGSETATLRDDLRGQLVLCIEGFLGRTGSPLPVSRKTDDEIAILMTAGRRGRVALRDGIDYLMKNRSLLSGFEQEGAEFRVPAIEGVK